MKYTKIEGGPEFSIPKIPGDYGVLEFEILGAGSTCTIQYGSGPTGLANSGGSLTTGATYYFEVPVYSYDKVTIAGGEIIRSGIRSGD
jgi:hypothetical protein